MTTRTKDESAVETAALAGNHGFSLISSDKLLQLYTAMVKCRMIEERVRDLIGRGKLPANGHDAAGREAAVTAVAIDLLAEDTVVPSQCDYIVKVIEGAPLASVFKSLFHSAVEPSLKSQLNLAAGAAVTNKMEKNGKIAVVFLSGEINSLAVGHEELLDAGASRLPILFVWQPILSRGPANGEAQTISEEIGLDAQAWGFPCIVVDGSDVVAVYRVATEAIVHARKGNGPTLIECGNCGSEEIDPILKMEVYLSRKGLFSEELKHEVATRFSKELDAAIEAGEAGPLPRSPESPAPLSS